MADVTELATVVLVVVAVVTVGSGSAIRASGAVAPTPVASERPGASADLQGKVDADDVLLNVDLRSDGSAVWQVEYRVRLDDANTTEAFEELQSDIEANESAYLNRFADRIRNTVSTAENRTGREMAASDFSVTTDRRQLPREYGVVTYSFEWRGFARTDSTTMRVGDALDGLFLDAQTTLLVGWPDGFAVSTVTPTPDETRPRAVVWVGPTDFGAGEPTLVLTSAPATTTAETTTHTTATSDERTTATEVAKPSDGDGGLSTVLVAGTLLALVAVGVALAIRRQRVGESGETPEDAELLTNEERVLELLEANGGRVKQQTVVEELDWTEAKTSRVVNSLHEEGRIDVFRLGRENVLSLPEYDT